MTTVPQAYSPSLADTGAAAAAIALVMAAVSSVWPSPLAPWSITLQTCPALAVTMLVQIDNNAAKYMRFMACTCPMGRTLWDPRLVQAGT